MLINSEIYHNLCGEYVVIKAAGRACIARGFMLSTFIKGRASAASAASGESHNLLGYHSAEIINVLSGFY